MTSITTNERPIFEGCMWDDLSKTLSLEPASKQTATRIFQVELNPDGRTKEMQYNGLPLELKLFLE
jgi:hypothetical protein